MILPYLSLRIPDCWEIYISVDDIESAVATVSTSGSRLLGPVMGAPCGGGRLVVVADPIGAIVILWQPLKHHGACLVKEHGTTS